jgi:hypothetical protein
MVRRRSDLEDRDDYRALRAELTSLLESIAAAPADVRFRFTHDLLCDTVPEIQNARGMAAHDLVFDHSYEEIGALVGLSRQRLQTIHLRWCEVTSTPAWPKTGRWSRIWSRRQAEVAAQSEV